MKRFDVTVRATVTKTISVDAENYDDAVEQAHEQFSVFNDGEPENYEQETHSVEEVGND